MDMLSERLHDRFPETRQAVIDRLVGTALRQYEDSTVRAFIPVLVEREVSDRLRILRPRRIRAESSARLEDAAV